MSEIPEWLEIVVSILCIIALLLILWWKAKPAYHFRKRSVDTQGTIVNWMKAKTRKAIFFYPMIEFKTDKGIPVKFKAQERSKGKPMYPVGTKVTVQYDPQNPEKRKVTYPNKTN